MVSCSTEEGDDTAISFEIGSVLEPNNVVFDEIEEQDIPDELLVGHLDEVKKNEAIIQQRPTAFTPFCSQCAAEEEIFKIK